MIPLIKDGSGLTLAGDPELFDYQQLIIEKDMEREVINTFFDYLSQKDWKVLEFPSVASNLQKNVLMEIADQRGSGRFV